MLEKQYSCEKCRNAGSEQYCKCCRSIETPSGKVEYKPSLFEHKNVFDEQGEIILRCAILHEIKSSAQIPIEWVEAFNKIVTGEKL